MATDGRSAFEERTLSNFEPDVGVVDEHELCECSHCDRPQEYRVPWPQIGGDVAYCDYHLARYRENHPEIWGRLRALDGVEDPNVYAVVGEHFLTLDEVPEEISVDSEKMRRVALGVDGLALFDSAEPDDDGSVRFRTIGRDLEARETVEIARDHAGAFVTWYRKAEGIHALDPDATRFTEVAWMPEGGAEDDGGLDHVVLRRPIARWVDDRKVPANPVTKEVLKDSVGTPLIPRRRIAGVDVNRVCSEAVPVRGFRDGRFVLAIAPEHASVDVFDPSEREPGEPALDVTESWVPLVAVFTAVEKAPVVVPRREVDL